jgi:hypothetical protein
MREWIKNGARLIFACMTAGALAFGLFLFNAFSLNDLDGAHTYYLYSPSSQAQMQTVLCPFDALFLTGESVCFSVTAEDKENFPKEIAELFRAELIAVESVSGVTSYYLYSTDLRGGVRVQGRKVNLHIAVSGESCVVGTPIIFGGF